MKILSTYRLDSLEIWKAIIRVQMSQSSCKKFENICKVSQNDCTPVVCKTMRRSCDLYVSDGGRFTLELEILF